MKFYPTEKSLFDCGGNSRLSEGSVPNSPMAPFVFFGQILGEAIFYNPPKSPFYKGGLSKIPPFVKGD
jgi:hypothetical protein